MAKTGVYNVVLTTTPGTGVAGHAAPVAADLSTKPFIHLFNAGDKLITIDYIKIRMTAIGAGASTTDFDIWLDQASTPATTRSGAGTQMSARSSTAWTSPTGATIFFGAVTSVGVNARRVGHWRVRSVVPVVEDQYYFSFGAVNYVPFSGLPTTGTNQAVLHCPFGQVDVAPGTNFELVEWGVSQSGAHSMDAEVGYWENV